jgi:ribosomal protein S6--L-glutamate ligase
VKLCFLVEDRYRNDSMPLDVVRHLQASGHDIDVVEPGRTLVRTDELLARGHDAWVLKTLSGGPGLTLFDAAAAAGIPTVNDARAVHTVRDKTVAAALARRHGLPCPPTRFVAAADLLRRYDGAGPVVVKPAAGNSGRGVHLVRSARDLRNARRALHREGFLLVQPYIPNRGVDVKVYSIAGELHATVRTSPLHPDRPVATREIPLPDDLAALVTRVGRVYGLDLLGVDAVEGPDGWSIVDVNDFPSFHGVPDAVPRVAAAVLRLTAARETGLEPRRVAAGS